ncbi:MAG: thioredoxin family protein [Gemmatimonadetes bacterium]|nr:thioredoxin family protein [Gemmatimonadota bacterium]
MKLLTFFLLGIVIVAVGYTILGGQKVLTSSEPVLKEVKNLLGFSSDLPIIKKAPELVGLASWMNSKPFLLEELTGKVVLVDFWTYTCINCIRNIPHIKALYEKYKDNGLVVLGVHTPEFEFEKDVGNVRESVKEYGVEYPVALDNDYATWNAFENRFWPALYLIDAKGNIRYTHFGEGKYAETEAAIQQLLLEANLLSLDKITKVTEPPLSVDFQSIGTPEIYFGASRINNIGNPIAAVKINEPYEFKEPKAVEFNRFYLVGTWRIMPEFAQLVEGEGKVLIRYKANKLNIVFDTKGEADVLARVKLDGKYLTKDNRGEDIVFEGDVSFLKVQGARLYNLVDTKEEYGTHTLELFVPSSELEFFAFTFG